MLRIAALAVTSAVAISSPSAANVTTNVTANVTTLAVTANSTANVTANVTAKVTALAVTSAVSSPNAANVTTNVTANVTIERHLEAKVNASVALHTDVAAKAEKKEIKKHEETAKKANTTKAEKKDDVKVKSEKADAKTPAAAAKTETASFPSKAEEFDHFLAKKVKQTPAAPAAYVMPDSNASANADICSCEFRGVCGCEAAIEFMDCVSAACNSGKCDCHETQFQHACTSIAGECSSLEMECESDRAACLVEEETIAAAGKRTQDRVYAELRDLKEERCRLELAEQDGWLNAGVRLRTVRHDIDTRMQELEVMKAPTPEMHCEKHFEEFHMPVTAKPSAAFQPGAAVCLFITLLVSRMTM